MFYYFVLNLFLEEVLSLPKNQLLYLFIFNELNNSNLIQVFGALMRPLQLTVQMDEQDAEEKFTLNLPDGSSQNHVIIILIIIIILLLLLLF